MFLQAAFFWIYGRNSGGTFSSKDLSKISGFGGKRPGRFNFFVSNLLIPTQQPRTLVHVSSFLKMCVRSDSDLPISVSLGRIYTFITPIFL